MIITVGIIAGVLFLVSPVFVALALSGEDEPTMIPASPAEPVRAERCPCGHGFLPPF